MRWTPRLLRLLLNLYPPYWATGITIERISSDWRELDVAMRLRFYNRNYFGGHFGGNLYAMVDPHYVLLLIQVLGPGYRVIDQAANIEFVRQGLTTVRAHFRIEDDLLEQISERTAGGTAYRPELPVEIRDEQGQIVARVTKTVYVKRRGQPKERRGVETD